MRYLSTRGGIAPVSFKQAVMMGLATDGGLLLPESVAAVDAATLADWRHLSYPDLACAVLSRFIDDIPAPDLRELVLRSYASFKHPEIVPLLDRGDCTIMELFHGPTLAFKDEALQFLGNLFEYLLQESGGRMKILGATSGDTGSAAIYGVRGKERIAIFILHPHKRVSPIQELQMTSVVDPNVFNLAIRGTFDDGQAIVKTIFNDIDFKESHQLGAINSINWARIVAQVVYYVHAALRLGGEAGGPVDFSVPTGNFGDIFAGFLARRMLPGRIRRLVLATNENNLLTRFVLNGDYSLGRVVQTSSPSMDIQVASNFERYLYYLNAEDAGATRRDMDLFAASGNLRFEGARLAQIQADFASLSVSQEETTATIRDFYREQDYLLDPHTAVGVKAGLAFKEAGVPMVCLATAHPAKFGDAVRQAIGHEPELPPALAALTGRETRCELIDAEVAAVRDFVQGHAL